MVSILCHLDVTTTPLTDFATYSTYAALTRTESRFILQSQVVRGLLVNRCLREIICPADEYCACQTRMSAAKWIVVG